MSSTTTADWPVDKDTAYSILATFLVYTAISRNNEEVDQLLHRVSQDGTGSPCRVTGTKKCTCNPFDCARAHVNLITKTKRFIRYAEIFAGDTLVFTVSSEHTVKNPVWSAFNCLGYTQERIKELIVTTDIVTCTVEKDFSKAIMVVGGGHALVLNLAPRQ